MSALATFDRLWTAARERLDAMLELRIRIEQERLRRSVGQHRRHTNRRK